MAQDIIGTGTLANSAAGTVTLTGTNTYSRPDDDLRGGHCRWATAGQPAGWGRSVTVTGATTNLRINRSDALSWGRVIGGTGTSGAGGDGDDGRHRGEHL